MKKIHGGIVTMNRVIPDAEELLTRKKYLHPTANCAIIKPP